SAGGGPAPAAGPPLTTAGGGEPGGGLARRGAGRDLTGGGVERGVGQRADRRHPHHRGQATPDRRCGGHRGTPAVVIGTASVRVGGAAGALELAPQYCHDGSSQKSANRGVCTASRAARRCSAISPRRSRTPAPAG